MTLFYKTWSFFIVCLFGFVLRESELNLYLLDLSEATNTLKMLKVNLSGSKSEVKEVQLGKKEKKKKSFGLFLFFKKQLFILMEISNRKFKIKKKKMNNRNYQWYFLLAFGNFRKENTHTKKNWKLFLLYLSWKFAKATKTCLDLLY